MDDERFREEISTPPPAPPNRGLWAVVIVLLCAFAASLIYAFRQRQDAQLVASNQDQMSAALTQTRGQVDSLTAQLTDMNSRLTSAQQAAQEAEQKRAAQPVASSSGARATRHARVQREDPRWKKMQGQIDDEQKQIASTQQDLSQARTDLESNLN